MPYVANVDTVQASGNGEKYYGESQECVAAVKHFAKAPQTALWKKGKQVKGNISIPSGTAIATFDANGKYKGHAAIYIKQDGLGLRVYDQWRGREFEGRTILFRGSGYVSNDGDQFYVID